jgi:hypothetical protein
MLRKISEIVKLTHYRTLKALAAQHLPLQPRQPFKLGRRSRSDRPTKASPILVAFGAHLLSVSEGMRLLAEILIIAALIYFGWNKPFNEYVAQANTTITTKLHGAGKGLQKHQDPSVRRY